MLRTMDVYWLAGLLEGEGSFYIRRKWDATVEVAMTDQDVIQRVGNLLPFGLISEWPLDSGKISYRWRCLSQPHAAGLMMMFLPLMGERRAGQIRASLALWKQKPLPKSMWTHCKNGHELSGDNLRIVYENGYEKRRCRKCVVLRQRKYKGSNLMTEPDLAKYRASLIEVP